MPATTKPVFISYAHADNVHAGPSRRWLDVLIRHLKPYVRQGEIEFFSDRELVSGDDWNERIQQALAGAKVAILLVSSSFLASDYIANSELPVLLQKAKIQGLTVKSIILSPCAFTTARFKFPDPASGPDEIDLSTFEAANPPSNTLQDMMDTHEEADCERIFVTVAEQVRDLLHSLSGPPRQMPGVAGQGGSAPVIHNLPFSSLGGLFRGREVELLSLMATRGPAAITQTIHGLGGVGKTRLAVELGWYSVCERRHSAVLFAQSDTPDALRTNLARLAGTLGLPESANPDETAQYEAVMRWLGSRGDWLLILDNVDSDDAATAVKKVLPHLANGHLLITSRRHGWPAGVRTAPLKVLDLDVAAKFLLDRADDRPKTKHDETDARNLAERLGGLPLALEQAAAYLDARQCAFADYLSDWERDRSRVLEWADPTDTSLIPVALTYERTFAVLSPAAQAVLSLASFLAPDPIPLALFESGEERLAEAVTLLESAAETAAGPSSVRDAVADLAHYSLIEREDVSFIVHRMVQEAVRLRIPEAQRRGWIESALNLVNDYAPTDSDDVRTWEIWKPLFPHAEAIAERADQAGLAQPTTRLMSCMYGFFSAKSAYARAERWARRALAIDEAALGQGHPKVAIRLNNLASLLLATNRLSEAEPLLRQSLAIAAAAFGPNHPDVAIPLNNLAQLLQATNRLSEAEPLMRWALAIDEAALGLDHPDVARDLNNLAQLLQYTNRLSEAEPLMRRALEIDQASLGPDHPKVAIDLNNLASLLQDTNRLIEAEPLLRRALAIDEAAFGPDHPDVARSLNNLALLLHATNRLREAEPLMRRTVNIIEDSLGENHPKLATALNNLAQLLLATDRLSEAEPLMRRALAIDQSASGPDHPNVAIRMNNLALLLQDSNRLSEAEPLMRRALAIDEAAFGPDHPDVAIDLNNLAQLLKATDRMDEAEPMMRRALAIDEESYGPDHPDVAIDLVNLASFELAHGNKKVAVEMLRRALQIFRTSLGENHPNSQTALNYLNSITAGD